MPKYFLVSVGLISLVLLASFVLCSSIPSPINAISDHQDDHYSPIINSEEDESSNIYAFTRKQRSPSNYPRANRNTWFRVSTYQHFKPPASDDTSNGDHLMRWGR